MIDERFVFNDMILSDRSHRPGRRGFGIRLIYLSEKNNNDFVGMKGVLENL